MKTCHFPSRPFNGNARDIFWIDQTYTLKAFSILQHTQCGQIKVVIKLVWTRLVPVSPFPWTAMWKCPFCGKLFLRAFGNFEIWWARGCWERSAIVSPLFGHSLGLSGPSTPWLYMVHVETTCDRLWRLAETLTRQRETWLANIEHASRKYRNSEHFAEKKKFLSLCDKTFLIQGECWNLCILLLIHALTHCLNII